MVERLLIYFTPSSISGDFATFSLNKQRAKASRKSVKPGLRRITWIRRSSVPPDSKYVNRGKFSPEFNLLTAIEARTMRAPRQRRGAAQADSAHCGQLTAAPAPGDRPRAPLINSTELRI